VTQTITLRGELLHILQHSLGVDPYGQGPQFRNHFVAGGRDVDLCRELVSHGFMTEQPASQISGGDPWFRVTRAGIDVVALQSPKAPKVSRGKRRYLDYLDSDCPESFGEWLKRGWYRRAV
jgi:hypothetical protein